MSCSTGTPTFRLLDCNIGWDNKPSNESGNLAGFDDPAGLCLALETADIVDQISLLTYMPPPRFALGFGPCEQYIVTPSPPEPRLLWRTNCPADWLSVWDDSCDPQLMVCPVAISVWGHRIAVSDDGVDKVWVWTQAGDRLFASIDVSQPGPLAIAPWGELLVASHGRTLLRFGISGEPLGEFAPVPGPIERIRIGADSTIWLVTHGPRRSLRLWQAYRGDCEFKPAKLADLAKTFEPTGLIGASDIGFCLQETGSDGVPTRQGFSWYGRSIDPSEISTVPPPARHKNGSFETIAIDSGIPRCRWHRVRIDADVPSFSSLTFRVATSEDGDVPHEDDWWPRETGPKPPADSLDFLIDQPRGRYLFLRMTFTGNGVTTPTVQRIRLDFPRATSLELLPPVYRERPDAEDFTERFLSLFDASLTTLDRAIERFPALLDVDGTPDEVLPWLGRLVDVSFEAGWTDARMRKILLSVPELYRRRGTMSGLAQAIKLVFDVEPIIIEMAGDRAWARLRGRSPLGSTRLFGRSRARFRLGSSAISNAPLRSFGDPDADPLIAHANRFVVLVPPGEQLSTNDQQRLNKLVDSQKPAHTVASVRVGGNGFLLGTRSAIGIDTVFTSLQPPVLTEDLRLGIRLGRSSVLWHGRRGPQSGFLPGTTGVVGVNTIME